MGISLEGVKRKVVLTANAAGIVFFQACAYGSAAHHDPLKFFFCTAMVLYAARNFTVAWRRG